MICCSSLLCVGLEWPSPKEQIAVMNHALKLEEWKMDSKGPLFFLSLPLFLSPSVSLSLFISSSSLFHYSDQLRTIENKGDGLKEEERERLDFVVLSSVICSLKKYLELYSLKTYTFCVFCYIHLIHVISS